MTLKQEAIAPFVRLLETKGVLHTEHFVGMGFHDDRLYLLKLHARPEEVVARGDDFLFLNKKGDGPTFNVGNNQTLTEAAAEYHFYGKDGGTTFADTLMIPQSEMERMLLISTLKKGLTSLLNGEKPTEEALMTSAITDLFQHPGVQQVLQNADAEQVTDAEAQDLLSQAFSNVNQQMANPAPVTGEQPASDATDAPADALYHDAMAGATATESSVADAATPTPAPAELGERRRGIRGKLYAAMGFGPAI
jgi:hypothetical protein